MGKSSWGWKKDTDWYSKISDETAKHKYPCPKCGRKMIMSFKMDKTICDYCGTLIYKDEKARFKDKMRKMIIKEKSKEE